MNKFRMLYKDVFRLYGRKPKNDKIKTPADCWLWYINFGVSVSKLRTCVAAKNPSVIARRLCKSAREINIVGCIGGSTVFHRRLENPDVAEIERLVAQSIKSKGQISSITKRFEE